MRGFDTVRCLVVKIGSALLVDSDGLLRHTWLDSLAADIAAFRERKCRVIIVTSGAVALGRHRLGLIGRTLRLEEKQAAAAVGQPALVNIYRQVLAKYDLDVAQILLTLEDTEARRRHLNARATVMTLLELGVVPVINENDTVATSEIRFGDNDRLAARVAQMISADTLILLSDIDGLYTADPKNNPEAQHIPFVRELTSHIQSMAGRAPLGYSSGGMVTKLEAARIAMAAGCILVIARGTELHPLRALVSGSVRSTWFEPVSDPGNARKRWIAGTLKPNGALIVDDGAVAALQTGKSLLPAGVVGVRGTFERGDTVEIFDTRGSRLGQGLAMFTADEAARIAGFRSDRIAEVLGYHGRAEIVHRDDLVLGEYNCKEKADNVHG